MSVALALSPAESKPRPRATVLCIDDDRPGLVIRKLLLESQGYAVLTAGSGAEGLELFALQPVDVVVLDYMMPEMNGEQVAIRLRESDRRVPIVILTGCLQIPERIMRYANALVLKSGDAYVLLNALQACLDDGKSSAQAI